MIKRIFVLMICAALCLSLLPSAFADGVILWERLDTGDVIAMTREPTEEELKNLKLHVHSFGNWVVTDQASCSEAGMRHIPSAFSCRLEQHIQNLPCRACKADR